MKDLIFLLVVFLMTSISKGQQTVQYSQYLLNDYALNPAVAGTKQCLDIRFGSRRQWVGFPGAPTTYFASINSAFGKIRGGFTHGWHGIGAYIENDKTGPYSVQAIYPSYTYHRPIYRDYVAALGFFVGIRYHFYSGNGPPSDPALNNNRVFLYPDITPGLLVYSKTNYFGLSVKQLMKRRITGGGEMIGTPSKLKPHFYFTYSKKIASKAYYYTYVPSIHIKYTALFPPAIDISGMMYIKDKFAFGLSYRVMDAVIGMIKLKIYKYIDMGYAFDFTTSRMRYGGANTHEIILTFNPCPFDEIAPIQLCPAY